MAAPAIKINGGSPGAKAAIAANTSFSATLDSTAGVRTVEWDILSTDETSAADDYTLVTSGTVGQTVTLTSLGEGTAAILHVKVNGGYSTQTGLRDPTGTEATAKFYVALPSGLEVGAANEKLESDPTTGATSLLNAGIRLADTLDVGQYDAQYLVRTASSVLTDETAIDAITSTVTFQSTSTTPLGAKRTDSATTATVDVAEVTALSSGTAAAGFGPTVKFIGEVTGGGAENYGRVGFVAEDLTAGSEDTAFVAQARTAGGALADVLKVSGTKITFPALAGGGSGNLAVNNDGDVSMGAGGSYVATSTTITATSPIRIDGASSADLSTGRTLSFSVGADVPWGGNGITGIASLDNSGGAMTIGANTTEQTIGKSGTTAAFAGNVSVAGTATIPGAGSSSERVGASTTAAGANSTAFGNGAKADSSGAVALGQGVQITGSATDTICIGRGITTTSAQGVTIGANASNYSQAVAVGVSASAGSSGVAIGYGAGASASQSVSIGRNASGGGTNNIAIGYNSSATGSGGATESIALGAAATTGYTNCIAIGGGASCTAANQLLLGGANCSITDAYLGKGVTHATPAGVTIHATGGSTSGVTGGAITIAGGKGGAAADAGGAVNIQTAAAGTGTTLETRMSFAASGARTDSFPSSGVHRTEHGTASTNYVDSSGVSATVNSGATSTIYTIPTSSNSYVNVFVWAKAHDTTATTDCVLFGKRRGFKNISGTVTAGTQVDLFADDAVGTVWGAPPTLSITFSGTDILVQGTATTNNARFTITRVEWHVATTTA